MSSPARPVLLRYFFILWLYGNTDVVAPISAPMLQIVAMPVEKQSPRHEDAGQLGVSSNTCKVGTKLFI